MTVTEFVVPVFIADTSKHRPLVERGEGANVPLQRCAHQRLGHGLDTEAILALGAGDRDEAGELCRQSKVEESAPECANLPGCVEIDLLADDAVVVGLVISEQAQIEEADRQRDIDGRADQQLERPWRKRGVFGARVKSEGQQEVLDRAEFVFGAQDLSR
jgi:hypothetical protein